MQKAQSTEAPVARTPPAQLRNLEALAVSGDDVSDDSPPVDQDTHLTPHFSGKLGQVPSEIRRDDLVGPKSTPVEVGQTAKFRGLEPREVSVNRLQDPSSGGSSSSGASFFSRSRP